MIMHETAKEDLRNAIKCNHKGLSYKYCKQINVILLLNRNLEFSYGIIIDKY